MKTKIIGICGSPRKGNCEFLLREALEAAKKLGAETELVLLREKKIEYCDGCCECEEGGKSVGECHINDDMQELYKKLDTADGIILASPNYFENVSGLMKNFMDRSLVFYSPRMEKLKGKLGGIIAVGGSSSHDVTERLKVFFSAYSIKVVGVVEAVASSAGEISKDKKALDAARKLGEKLAKVQVG